jgi:hypothetical protein
LVDVVLPCGHAARVRCWQAARLQDVRCTVPVACAAHGCGHELTLPCDRVGELADHPERCTAPCRSPLQDCAHLCAAACGACRGPLVLPTAPPKHAPCAAKCQRGLLCGHACSETCHSAAETPCPPCGAHCAVACEHSACSNPCAKTCAPCAEPCGWECEHRGACALPCGAPCDRLPCDARCTRVLACGHRCPSLCGEPCPGPDCCRECAPPAREALVVDLIMSSTLAEHDPDDSPLLALPCGHVFTTETLDGCVALHESYQRDAATGEWSAALSPSAALGALPACPLCRAPLRGVRRYGRVLNHAACQQAQKKFVIAAEQSLAAAEAQLREAAAAAAGGLLAAGVAAATRARKALQAHARACAEPPTVRVHLACMAALQRAGLPTEQLSVPKPDAGPRCRAQLGVARAHSQLMILAAIAMCVPAAEPHALGGRGGGRGRGRGQAGGLGRGRGQAAGQGAVPPSATLASFEQAAADSVDAFEQALVLAVDGQLRATARRCHAHLAQHLVQHVAEWLRLRDSAAHAVPEELVQHLRAQLQRAGEAADAACEGAQVSEGKVVSAAKEVRQRLSGLIAALQSVLSDAEARMVLNTLGFTDEGNTGQGHWYQCPNGHVYLITECGGAMHEARCNECGAVIGGSSHTLRTDNAQASDFLRRGSAP